VINGSSVRRVRQDGGARVTNMELFFDLVYVLAVTQLSHLLLGHLNWHGAAQTALLLLAIWWAWVFTAWFTNWFNPDTRTVRLPLVMIMLASLIMSATLPDAFGDRGLYVAAAYAAMQVGRTLWVVLAAGDDLQLRRNYQRILAWLATAAVFWVAGGFAHDSAREVLWLAALAIEGASPALGFYTPGLGRSTTADWHISGRHLAERCSPATN
jgi:low temperature requirement protein LtrA